MHSRWKNELTNEEECENEPPDILPPDLAARAPPGAEKVTTATVAATAAFFATSVAKDSHGRFLSPSPTAVMRSDMAVVADRGCALVPVPTKRAEGLGTGTMKPDAVTHPRRPATAGNLMTVLFRCVGRERITERGWVARGGPGSVLHVPLLGKFRTRQVFGSSVISAFQKSVFTFVMPKPCLHQCGHEREGHPKESNTVAGEITASLALMKPVGQSTAANKRMNNGFFYILVLLFFQRSFVQEGQSTTPEHRHRRRSVSHRSLFRKKHDLGVLQALVV